MSPDGCSGDDDDATDCGVNRTDHLRYEQLGRVLKATRLACKIQEARLTIVRTCAVKGLVIREK